MLPFYSSEKKSNKTIYINPNFKAQPAKPDIISSQPTSVIPKNAHINPLFLEAHKTRNTIHMNPAFLQKFQEQQQQHQQKVVTKNSPESDSKILFHQPADVSKSVATEHRKIICKSKNYLIREPLMKKDETLKVTKPPFPLQPLLVLNKRKLIRKVSNVPGAELNRFDESKTRMTKYKLDNRLIRKKQLLPPTPRIRRISYLGPYALKRTSFSETSITSHKNLIRYKNKHKNLQVLNINGLLYKSTQNSLTLKDTTARTVKAYNPNTASEKSKNINQGLTIFVRGNKYIMDANKFKLTRVTNCDHVFPNRMKSSASFKPPTCQRIDIGGYTYVSINSAKNVLIRTRNHLSRAYVHNAKQKSLQMLTRSLVKTNIPCPIFRRIGKCAAFERGKCSKVHNKLQVVICSKFLRGECLDANCLLSHNVSLSKMPVCKFFLQGVCVRNDCPYLHKKLSKTAELCADFLRGFCQLADKCGKRHEFVCPEIERNNICRTKNCTYCNAKRRKESVIEFKLQKQKTKTVPVLSPTNTSAEVTETETCMRYFKEPSGDKPSEIQVPIEEYDDTECFDENTKNTESNSKTRPKLGALPAYIPL